MRKRNIRRYIVAVVCEKINEIIPVISVICDQSKWMFKTAFVCIIYNLFPFVFHFWFWTEFPSRQFKPSSVFAVEREKNLMIHLLFEEFRFCLHFVRSYVLSFNLACEKKTKVGFYIFLWKFTSAANIKSATQHQ